MQNKIQNYINENASYTIQKRGQNLLYSNAIKDFVIDINKNEAIFLVKGTHLYSVEIKNLNGKIKTSCTCPYDWGGICKHEVASLLYLINYFDKNPNKNKKESPARKIPNHIPQKKSSLLWKEIPEYSKINIRLIYSLSDTNMLNVVLQEMRNFLGTQIDILEENYVKFIVKEFWEKYNVEFKLTRNKLKTKCNCKAIKPGLCKHQIRALLYVKDELGEDFFTKIDIKAIQKIKKETIKEYGLPETEKFDDWFEIKFDNKVNILKKEKTQGLVKIKKYRKEENKLYKILKSKEAGILTHIPENSISEFEIGYVFLFDPDREKINRNTEIIQIYGKPNKAKTKLSTFIRNVSQKEYGHNIILSEKDEKLSELCKQINFDNYKLVSKRKNITNKDSYISDLEDIKFYLPKLDVIFKETYKHPFIYKSYSGINRNDLIQINISKKTPQIFFKLYDDDNFIYLSAFLQIDDLHIKFNDENLIMPHLLIIQYGCTFYLLNSIKDAFTALEYIQTPDIKIIKSDFDNFFNDFVKPISEYYSIEIMLSNYNTKMKQLKVKEKKLYISEMGKFVIFNPTVVYDENLSVNILTHGNFIEKNENTIIKSYRDLKFEEEYYTFLKSLHPKFKNQFREDFLHLQIDDLIENYWFFDAFERITENNIEVFGLNNLKNFKYSPNKANININIKSEQDWFDVKFGIKFGNNEISLKDIRKAIIKKERFVKLGDGTIGILPKEWFEKFEQYFRYGEIKGNNLKISKLKFSIIDKLFEKKNYAEIYSELAEKKKKLQAFTEIQNVKTPKNLQGKLRDYQKAGYNWLNFLDEFKWGGILADDMGLGKTIQVLAFLLQQKTKSKKANLIVVPATLLFNWKNETEKFTPDLSVFFHYGQKRAKNTKEFKKYNLVITTYGTLMRDIEFLRKYIFNYIILDESQAIKNPGSQRFKSAALLRGINRIALTGTPIENNTFDLYAQMDFLNPGFLGNQKYFKDNYSIPIDKNRNKERATELQNLINPFILRRTKEQVAKELPSKTEDFIYCEMETEQKKVYDAFRNKYRNFLLKKIDDEGIGKSKIYIIEGLMKLRQICNSPEILSDKEDYGKESVKVKELIRHIKEKTGKHKILVFSQFVKMLKIIERELVKESINYEYLDGQSSQKARKASVKNFQDNTNIRVFLISLKAGGTGINLTAADYVYIFDPWWNPAVENQAIDRCYRIGQDKKVIAYRMICKNTIEEKILKYQEKKRKVASDIITTDDSFVKHLKKEDVTNLFN